jgi:hypothetical protein
VLANPVCKFCILNLKYSFPCSSLLHYWVPYTRASYDAILPVLLGLGARLRKSPLLQGLFRVLRAPVKGKCPLRSYAVGVMFWLRRNMLVGSYLFLSATSLSYFSAP